MVTILKVQDLSFLEFVGLFFGQGTSRKTVSSSSLLSPKPALPGRCWGNAARVNRDHVALAPFSLR